MFATIRTTLDRLLDRLAPTFVSGRLEITEQDIMYDLAYRAGESFLAWPRPSMVDTLRAA